MPTVIAKFGTPENVSAPGLDGKAIRFPCAFIDAQHLGTPRQTSETKSVRITVEISGSLMAVWGLKQSDLIKVLFKIAKEHLEKLLKKSEKMERDIKVTVNTYTHKGPCALDPQFIDDPNGATIQVEVTRPIGFIWDS